MIIGEEGAVSELWDAARRSCPRRARTGRASPSSSSSDPPAGRARPVSARRRSRTSTCCCPPVRRRTVRSSVSTRSRRPGRRSGGAPCADRGGPLLALGRGRHDPVQGGGLGLDAERGTAPAGLGRPRGAEAGQRDSARSRDLCRLLLERTPAVCLFVRPENAAAIRVYEKIGMRRARNLPKRALLSCDTVRLTFAHGARVFRKAVEAYIRRHELIAPGGEVTCLVSGGADSTCLWHVLRELGYARSRASRRPRPARRTSRTRTRASAARSSARRSSTARGGATEDELREIRYSFATDRLRATGHTASDQVETVLYRLVASGAPGRIEPKREDGVVRPLLELWRDETEAYCRAEGLAFRRDTSNPDTKRGLIREQILPLLRELHPAAEGNLLRLADRERPPELDELLASTDGSRGSTSAGDGRRARVRPRLARAVPRRARRRGAVGARGDRIRPRRALRYAAGGPATGSPAAGRRSRTCSSTPRSRDPSARRGRSWCAATRSWRFPASSRRRV